MERLAALSLAEAEKPARTVRTGFSKHDAADQFAGGIFSVTPIGISVGS